jgi:hypothetical protein
MAVAAALPPGPQSPVTPHHLVWDSPSKDCHGSMPLGNGDISLNAWIEPSGDLCFYIGKTDSWDDNARLLKLGKIRVKLDPAPPVSPFKQELALADGMMAVTYGDGTVLRLWADANHPVVEVAASSNKPVTATATLELWRTKPETLPSLECSDVMNKAPAGEAAPTVVEPDVILPDLKDRVGWYHHNIKSVGPATHARIQGVTGFQREDPLRHPTFGAIVTATRPERVNDLTLRSAAGTDHRFSVHLLTRHPSTPDQWLAAIDQQLTATEQSSHDARFQAHRQWWRDFWNRSWINAESKTPPAAAPANTLPLKVGVNQHDGDKFTGEIRNPVLPADLAGDFTIEAEIKPSANATGRIFDKITPGGADGFLLDCQPAGRLRLIVGPAQYFATTPPPANTWSKIVVRASAGGWTVAVNGNTVINTGSDGPARDDASYLSQMFALQRFITACAGRGAYPIKFNGSIFTVPHPSGPGVLGSKLGKNVVKRGFGFIQHVIVS